MNVGSMQLVVFDLDNTIVDETIWLYAAYHKIALSVEARTGKPRSLIVDFMTNHFVAQGRKNLFQDMCRRFDLPLDEIDGWLKIMRSVKLDQGFQVFEWVLEFCHLISTVPKAILTNGNPRQQESKFHQLTPDYLQREFKLYCAALYAPKPAIEGMQQIMADFGVAPGQILFIGDSEEDRACAAGAKVAFLDATNFRFQPVVSTLNQLATHIGMQFGSAGHSQSLD